MSVSPRRGRHLNEGRVAGVRGHRTLITRARPSRATRRAFANQPRHLFGVDIWAAQAPRKYQSYE